MKRKNSDYNEINGFGVSLTLDGPIFYYFNPNKTSFEELIRSEMLAFRNAKQNKHRLFKLYDIESVGYTVVSLN